MRRRLNARVVTLALALALALALPLARILSIDITAHSRSTAFSARSNNIHFIQKKLL